MILAHYIRNVFFVILVSYSCNQSFSQDTVYLNPTKRISQFPIKSWDMDKGMPSDMVIGVAQCKTGYIWLATYKGIARFDGENFSVFNNNTSEAIQSVTTQSIAKDSEGNLWFASQKGLVKYSNYLFSRDPNLVKLNNTSVEALYFDLKTNSLWIGTTSEGIYLYRSKTLQEFPEFRGHSKAVVKTINGDSDGNIWIGTEDGSVLKYDGQKFIEVLSDKSLGGIGSFYSTKDGELWVATEHGVFKLIDDLLRYQKSIPIEKATSIIKDNHSSLWIGSENGLYRYHLKTGFLDHIDEEKGLPNNLVKDIFADNEGNLWVATYRKGVFKLSDGLITNFSDAEGLSSNLITSIVQVGEDKFYVADEYGTINILENDKISQLVIKNDISRDRLKNLYFDSNKNLWISTYGGLLKVEPNGREVVYNSSKGLPAETIRLTFEDDNENIWIGTRSNGLFKLDTKGEIKEFSLETGLSSNYIMSINQDKLGRIVVATKNGINIIKNDLVEKVLDMDSGLPSDFAFNIHIDNDNVFWVASNDGIIRIQNDNDVFVYDIQNGLFDNTLFDILEDEFGFFWIPTDLGIVNILKDDLNKFANNQIENYSYRIFGRSDGMKNPRCIGATKSLKASDGRLFFTTSGGVSIVNPVNVTEINKFINILIESVVVNGKVILPSEPYEIRPGSNRVQVNYTAIHYKDPEKILFRYQLKPFDNQWIEVGGERVAQYTNIPAGSYTFFVQATNQEGDWSQEPISIKIFVDKIWWKTWWFRVALAFIMAFVLWLIYKARIYTVKLHQIELERLVTERTALIDQQKMELKIQSRELEKLSIVASHTNNAIMMTSPTGIIIWVNESFTRIYGYTLEEFIAEYGTNLARVSHDPNIQYMIEKSINEKKTSNYTVEVRTKAGDKLWIQTTLTPVKNEDGSVRVIVAIDTDITELKQVEKEMISLNNEIMMQTEAMLLQNEEIQTQRDELEQVNNLLFKHNQNIESSIWYAHTIQKAILPSKSNIDKYFEHFVVFKPRDIVSGDFYWFNRLPGDDFQPQRFIMAIVDCTGHGVPGALMSMIGSRLISEIVNERNITDPAKILVELNKLINIVLKQETEDNIVGMDIALCYVEKESNNNFSITFSGANRPIYILRKGSKAIETIKGNRKTIGGIMPDLDAEFQNHSFNLTKGDMIFMNSDGYIDQNGEDGRKLSVARYHNMIIEKATLPMNEIGDYLDVSFDIYRGMQSQRDDAIVLGIRF